MEQVLKERLVGAVVLVVVSVAIIPWVLDGPNRSHRTTESFDLPAATSNSEIQEGNSKTFRFSLADEQAANTDQAADGNGDGKKAQVIAPRTTTAQDSAQVAARAQANLFGWTVQVGSFSNRGNARALVGNLKSQGFEAYINEHDTGGTLHFRVRVGKFELRDEADSLAIRIRGETGEPARPVQVP